MQRRFKRGLSLFIVCVMLLAMLPAGVLAVSETTTTTSVLSGENQPQITKTVTYDPTEDTYTVTMEAFVTGEVQKETNVVPMDIVLVLDQSTSMKQEMSDKETRLQALKNAVTQFVGKIQQNAAENKVDHKVAIVGFGTEAIKLSDLKSANDNGIVNQELTSAIQSITANGKTYANLGLDMANSILTSRSDTAGRKAIVVFFTDGYPGEHTSETFYDGIGSGNKQHVTVTVANQAIQAANTLKRTATVYSIGFLNGADPLASYNFEKTQDTKKVSSTAKTIATAYVTAQQAVNAYMHFVSSDYEAVNDGTPTMETYDRTGVVNNGYYLAASDADGLTKVFEQIVNSSIAPTVELGGEAVLYDTMSDYFTLPADANESSVKVQTAQYMGKNDAGENTWAAAQSVGPDGINVVVDTEIDKISVSGFDYAANCVTTDEDGKPSGKKLIVSFQIIPNTACHTWQESGPYSTNSGAGIAASAVADATTYIVPDENNEDKILKAPVTTYSVTYNANAGTDDVTEMPSDVNYYISGQTATVANGTPVRTGYTFTGWNTVASPVDTNPGTEYSAGTLIAMDKASVTLYAQWTPNTYTITYEEGNVPETTVVSGMPQNEQNVSAGLHSVSSAVPTRNDNYEFDYWTTTDVDNELKAYNAGESFGMPSKDVTFTAVWKEKTTLPTPTPTPTPTPVPAEETLIVKFEAGEGIWQIKTDPKSFTLSSLDPGKTISAPAVIAPEGKEFDHWESRLVSKNAGFTSSYSDYGTLTNYAVTVEDGVDVVTWTAVYKDAVPKTPNKPVGTDLPTSYVVQCVTEGSGHESKAYGLLGDGYKIGDVIKGADGIYTCEITILGYVYAEKYNEETNTNHPETVNDVKYTMTWNSESKKWVAPAETDIAPIKVKCGSDAAPALTVTKSVNKTTAEVGDTLTYTITVKNTGNVNLTNITVTDEMLDVKETIQSLSVDDTWSKEYAYKVPSDVAGKTLLNKATVLAGDGTKAESNGVETEIKKLPDTPIGPVLNIKDHTAYIIGYEDGTVRPENEISRAEVATIFFRLMTDKSRSAFWSKENEFTDVNADDWYNNAISTLNKAGIINGYDDGTFQPDASITRAEFAAIVARFSDVIFSGSSSFSDVPNSHWAARYIALAKELGWATGYPNGTYQPESPITRAEAMTMINRVLERAVEDNKMLPDMVKWSDNPTDAWYYAAVQEATNSHKYYRTTKTVKENGTQQSYCYEQWTKILAVPDWAELEKTWSQVSD